MLLFKLERRSHYKAFTANFEKVGFICSAVDPTFYSPVWLLLQWVSLRLIWLGEQYGIEEALSLERFCACRCPMWKNIQIILGLTVHKAHQTIHCACITPNGLCFHLLKKYMILFFFFKWAMCLHSKLILKSRFEIKTLFHALAVILGRCYTFPSLQSSKAHSDNKFRQRKMSSLCIVGMAWFDVPRGISKYVSTVINQLDTRAEMTLCFSFEVSICENTASSTLPSPIHLFLCTAVFKC